MEALAIRLLPGDDPKAQLESLAVERGISAACILSCAGSLRQAAIRFAGEPDALILEGPLEIISLSGTLSASGRSHLHIAVSDGRGAVIGGHLKEGGIVRTTAEIVIGILPGIHFRRDFDSQTGHPELVIEHAA